MFSLNRVTMFLYEFGYDGVEDIYLYWQQHKNTIKQAYKKRVIEEVYTATLRAFEHQIIWHSVYGIFLRFEIARFLRHTSDTHTSLQGLSIQKGKARYHLEEFLSDYGATIDSNRTNLRGTSLIQMEVSNITIENVSFDYASLDGSQFQNVHFKNCSFVETSFRTVKFRDGSFDSSCVFQDNDFTSAVIHAKFDSQIVNPCISTLKLYLPFKRYLTHMVQYPKFTIILSDSFVGQASTKQVQDEYRSQEGFRMRLKKHHLIKQYIRNQI